MESKELTKKESFVKNSFWNGLAILLAKIGGMIFVIILARFLLPEKFGIYTLALTISMVIASLLSIAINQASSRYISESFQKGNTHLASSYFNYLRKLKIKLYLIITGISIILAYPLSVYIFKKPELFFPLLFFSVYVFVLIIQNFYESVFYAIKKIKLLTTKELLLQSTKIILCLILFLIFGESIVVAILSIIFSSLIASLFLKNHLKNNFSFFFDKSEKLIETDRVNSFIKKSTLSSIFNSIAENIDVIFLGFLVTSVYIGYFSVAILIVGGFFGIISLSNLSLPLFTQLNEVDTKNAFHSFFRYLSLISIPLIFGIFVFGKYLLTFLYGNSYLEATVILIVSSILLFECPLSELLKSFLLSKEKPEIISKAITLSLIIDLSLNFFILVYSSKMSMLLITILVSGVMVISRLFALVYLFSYIKKNFKISYRFDFLSKTLICSLISLLPFYFINSHLKDMTLLIGIIEVSIAGFFYLAGIILLQVIKKEDFSFIKKILNLN